MPGLGVLPGFIRVGAKVGTGYIYIYIYPESFNLFICPLTARRLLDNVRLEMRDQYMPVLVHEFCLACTTLRQQALISILVLSSSV